MSVSPTRSEEVPSGAVELREDAPLQSAAAEGRGGARAIAAGFAALALAITVALLTQVYSGHYQVVPHGAVSTAGAVCSGAGLAALRAGGGAADAAVAAALCLAHTQPHLTGLDSSGAMLFWEYRKSRSEKPVLVQWGEQQEEEVPRLLAGLAAVHARWGVRPWGELIQLANVSAAAPSSLSAAVRALPAAERAALGELAGAADGGVVLRPRLDSFLHKLQGNSSKEWCSVWRCDRLVTFGTVSGRAAGEGWRLYDVSPPSPLDSVEPETAPVASGVAVVDHRDVYLSLVIGMRRELGARTAAAAGWLRGGRGAAGLSPALLVSARVCGRRYVVAAGERRAGELVLARLPGGDLRAAVEEPREGAPAAVNVVGQDGDQLAAHADSRAEGVAARF